MEDTKILEQIKILYVEDDEQAREELHDVLKRRAGKVITADNGRQGLELYKAHHPDIILADLYMPEMDGIEMIRQIRADGSEPSVIVLSAVNEVDTVLDAVDAGINKYLLKPVQLDELLRCLMELAQEIYSDQKSGTGTVSENKRQLENKLKREFAAFIKTTTGKGPRDVDVFIRSGTVEITITEAMTVLEKNILDRSQNIVIIKNIRTLFYSVKEDDICRMIASVINRRVLLKEVSINVEKDSNKLIFMIEQDV